MLLTSLIIVCILLGGYILMSTVQINHINRAAVAMFCGVCAWIVYLIHGGDYLAVMGHGDVESVKDYISNEVITKYIDEACQIILFLIATNTIVEIMNNNGVFDSLTVWLRMNSSRRFLWMLSLLTFVISANVDNLTTVVLMMSIMSQIVSSRRQKIIYACVILVSANLGGSFTVIGDMTSLMLWVHGVVTPSAFACGLFLPVFTSLCVFNLLVSRMLVGKVEVNSFLNHYDGDDNSLCSWQKGLMLFVGVVGLWFMPTFHKLTHLPPFLGALTLLALIWVIEGMYNFRKNGNMMFMNRKYIRDMEFIGMRLILYFLGIYLGVGALVECGALRVVSEWLTSSVHNVYVYGGFIGFISALIDNIPFVMVGLNLFQPDQVGMASEFVQNGVYWQLLSYCSALGGSLLYVGTLSGHAVVEVEKIRLSWYFRHIFWRVLAAWAVGLIVFWFTHQ